MREIEKNPLRQRVEAYVREAVARMPDIAEEDIPVIVDVAWRALQNVHFVERGGGAEIFLLHLPHGRKRIDLTLNTSNWASSDISTKRYESGGVDFETRWLYLAAFVILQMRADERGQAILFEDHTGHTGVGETITKVLSIFSADKQPPRVFRDKSPKGEDWYDYDFKARILPRT